MASLNALLDRVWRHARLVKRKVIDGEAQGSPALAVAPEDIERFREPMFSYWRETFGHPPATCEMFLRDAFNVDGYIDAATRALRCMGDLRGRRILDVGCGWGGLSRVLAQCGAQITMVDPNPPHVEIAKARVPEGRGIVGSGTDLAACGLSDAEFDHVFVYSVIEHVGLPPDHRGDAGPVLDVQRRMIAEATRVLKPGGLLMVSTGNYLFPYDGEVQIWFFHYLPKAVQKELLQALGRSADRYGLLTWRQLVDMTRAAGLSLAHVETCEQEHMLKHIEGCMSGLFAETSTPAERQAAMGRIRKMVMTDPDWMHMWHAFFRKGQ